MKPIQVLVKNKHGSIKRRKMRWFIPVRALVPARVIERRRAA